MALESKKGSSFLSSPIVTVVLFLVFILFAFSTILMLRKARATHAVRTEYEVTLQALSQKADRLENDLSILETERGVEEELRKRYRVGKRGEEVLVVVEPEKSEEEATPKTPWYKRIFK